MSEVSRAVTHAPWTPRTCAEYMGFTTRFILGAVSHGVRSRGRQVQLEADTIVFGRRRVHLIHHEKFLEFLRALGWQRLPAMPVPLAQCS